jgi:hypothetical protein
MISSNRRGSNYTNNHSKPPPNASEEGKQQAPVMKSMKGLPLDKVMDLQPKDYLLPLEDETEK